MLRKFICGLLIGVILFNAIGYFGLYIWMMDDLDYQLKEKFEEGFSPTAEILIAKVPFALPYQTNLDGYKKADAEFESDGRFYKIVGQKLVNDTLYLMFLENKQATGLHKAVSEFASAQGNDSPATSSNKLMISFHKEFIPFLIDVEELTAGWSRILYVDDSLAMAPRGGFAPTVPPPDVA